MNLDDLAQQYADAITEEQVANLAEELGVTPESLREIGIGFDGEHAVFFERDAAKRVIGICARDSDGTKEIGLGHSRGIYTPANLDELPDPVLIVEGASDTAACVAMGFAVVGRPSAKVGAAYLAELLRDREVLVVGEFDPKRSGLWPGRDGAEYTAQALADAWGRDVPWTFPTDGAKDVREVLLQANTDDKIGVGEKLRSVLVERPNVAKPNSFPVSPIEEENEKREITIRVTPVNELIAEPEENTRWLVDGLLPWGGLSILAGKPKAGKSTLARVIALNVARGDSVLGRSTRPGPVMYLGLEDKRSEIAEHFRTMGAENEPLLVHTGPAPSSVGAAIHEVRDIATSNGAVLIIIDTMLRFVRVRDANDYAEMLHALDPVLELSRAANCHVMLVYHAPKEAREGLDGILGSQAIAGSCDTGMILTRKNDVRSLYSVQRYGEDMPPTVLTLDPVSRTIQSGSTLAEVRQSGIRKRILELLERSGELGESKIRAELGGDTGNTGTALRGLYEDKAVLRSGSGKRNDAYRYRLKDS